LDFYVSTILNTALFSCAEIFLLFFSFTWKMGSPIWNHFTKLKKCVCELGQTVAQPHESVFSQPRAECLLCRMLVKHSGNTSDAVTHLRIHHNDIYFELLPKFRKKRRKL
jgi:hypothetical protein